MTTLMCHPPYIPCGIMYQNRLCDRITLDDSFYRDPLRHLFRIGRKDSDSPVSGMLILSSLASVPVASASVLDLFLEDKNRIPAEWEDAFMMLHFFGTVYANPIGSLYVRSLVRAEGRFWTEKMTLLTDEEGFTYHTPSLRLP